MSNQVQAVCPGCKSRLRIPAEWVQQPIRCKHCGQVLKARRAAAPPVATPPIVPSTVPPVPASPPPAAGSAHVVWSSPPSAGSPFSDLDPGDESPLRRRRRGGWLGPVIFLAVLGLGSTGLALLWPRLQPLLLPPEDRPGARHETSTDDASTTKTPEARRAGPQAEVAHTPNRFPRRALVISIHNYLYANPIHHGPPGSRGNNVANFLDLLARDNSFKIPRTQCAHLSDAAGHSLARPPLKGVIEKALTDFLDSSRAQDRVMVFFIGHAVEIGDAAYLVPIEGELDRAATLIPLKWVFERLAACKARQKVLVMDVSRLSPTSGLERPDGGPLGPRLTAALQKPPAGVQVWSACSAGQHSYETDDAPEGAFLEALYSAAVQGVQNKIQHPDDPLPLDYFHERVNQLMAAELGPRKLEQVSFLAGQEQPEGAAFDAHEPAPSIPTLPVVPSNKQSVQLVRSVLEQIGTPPVKPSQESNDLTFDALPPFEPGVLTRYADTADNDSALRKAIENARAVLWAVSTEAAPATLRPEVHQLRQKLKVNLSVLRDGYPAPKPGGEIPFKSKIETDERDVARIIARLKDAQEELEAARELRAGQSKRWQANFDFMLARVEAQIAFLYEYESALGRLRKELPPRDPHLHSGWRLAATTKLQGDSTGRKLDKDARKIFDKMAVEHAGTPWEVLAKRQKLTALGLDWQPARYGQY